MNGTSPPLKVAILINGYESTYKPLTLSAFKTAIAAASLSSSNKPEMDFFDPIVAQIYPDPTHYDLIVLSGGTEDPMGSEPWVFKEQDFIRKTTTEHPQQKIVGVCWGHQTICVALGGEVGNMEGAQVGVTEIELTGEGKEIFPFLDQGKLKIHEFHRRDIKKPARGFVPLAADNQMFVNEDNTILTFQGHPELNTETAKAMLDAAPTYMGVEGTRREELYDRLGNDHNGVEIWRRILAWVKE